MLNVIYAHCQLCSVSQIIPAECHYAECHYAECRYAEFCYAECGILSVLAPNLFRIPIQIPNELYWLYIAICL